MCVYQSIERDVWLTPSQLSCTWPTGKTIEQGRLLQKPSSTRIVEAQNKESAIHISCQWFWNQIYEWNRFGSPHQDTQEHYEIKVDKDGNEFVKIELDWDYDNGKVHLSMKPYLEKALCQFNNVIPTKDNTPRTRRLNLNMEWNNNLLNMMTLPPKAKMTKNTFKSSTGSS